MSIRIRLALVGSNEKYAFRDNQGVSVNNALFRYQRLVDLAADSALARLSEEEYNALKEALNGTLFPDGNLAPFIIGRIGASEIPLEMKVALKKVVAQMPYVELCALMEIIGV